MSGAIAALGVQLTLTAVVFWPLPAHLLTSVAGGGFNWIIDVPLLLFVLAWESHALVADPARFFDAPMYAPAPGAGLYGPTGLGVLPLFAPVFLATGSAILALDVALMGGLALTAWTTHLVVRRWTGSDAAGLVAGAVLLTTEWISRGWVPSAPSYAALWWFPLIVARAARPIRGVADWTCLAVLAWLQCLTDVVYVAPAVLAPLVVIGAVRTARPATRRQGLATLGAALAAAAAMAPLLVAHARIGEANPALATQTTWSIRLPAALPSGLLAGPSMLEPGAFALLAAGALAAAWRGVTRRRDVTDAAWIALVPWWIVGIAISIGPAFFWFDRIVENPVVAWLHATVPALAALRAPDRLRVATLVSSALGAGLACATFLAVGRRLARRWSWPPRVVTAAITTLVLAGLVASVPHPLEYPVQRVDATPPELARVLRARRGAVVEVPAPPADTRIHVRAMLRAIDHRRPVLNGYSGYWPAGFPERMAVAGALPDRDALGRLRAETGLETVVVHRYRLTPDGAARWQRELADPGSPFRVAWQDAFLIALDVDARAADRQPDE